MIVKMLPGASDPLGSDGETKLAAFRTCCTTGAAGASCAAAQQASSDRYLKQNSSKSEAQNRFRK
jgi:hypothetical protein